MSAVSEVYAPPPFEQYQIILDKMPFGEVPAGLAASALNLEETKNAKQAQLEQERLAKQVNMSAVNITPEGKTAIGFTDLSQKPPVNYYLLVGAEADGWKVIYADYDEETSTIEKDGVAITLKLGAGMVTQEPEAVTGVAAKRAAILATRTKKAAPQPAGLKRQTRRPPLGVVFEESASSGQDPASTPGPSYVERIQERELLKKKEEQASHEKMKAQLAEVARKAAFNEIQRREQEQQEAAEQLEIEYQAQEQVLQP